MRSLANALDGFEFSGLRPLYLDRLDAASNGGLRGFEDPYPRSGRIGITSFVCLCYVRFVLSSVCFSVEIVKSSFFCRKQSPVKC